MAKPKADQTKRKAKWERKIYTIEDKAKDENEIQEFFFALLQMPP